MKHIRGGKHGLTPKGGNILPAALALSYTNHDLEKGRLLPDAHVVALAKRAIVGEWTALEQDSPVMGQVDMCYPTVLHAVKQFGGRLRMGWCMFPQSARTGRNRLAPYLLGSHVVWESDGRLFETIPAYRGNRFMLDDAIPFSSQMGISFLDRMSDVSKCRFSGANVVCRAISLSLASMLEPAFDQRYLIESMEQIILEDYETVGRAA
jgi:hypothetical protein